jgi:hypothetical protein
MAELAQAGIFGAVEKQVHRKDAEFAEIEQNILFAGRQRQTKSCQPPAVQKEPLDVTIILLFH